MPTMHPAQDALETILSSVHPTGAEAVDIDEAHRRVLAEDIIAGEDIPPFDNSAMDGYAIRAEDVSSPPAVLKVLGEVTAGQVSTRKLQPGEAIRIMTGSQIPPGANAVVQIEWVEPSGSDHVRILKSVDVDFNIRHAGEDIQKGQRVLPAGSEVRAAELGVLASLGQRRVRVSRKPLVGILATGDELVTVEETVTPGRIRNSNSYTLGALVEETGAQAVYLGIARDNRRDIRSKILEGLKCDVLITSGGVSVGDYDLVREILKDLGVEIKLWKVNIKPGMPLLFGVSGAKPVFGVPGNPVSAIVTFLKFIRPALRKILGAQPVEKRFVLHAELQHEIKKRDGKRYFIRAVLESKDGGLIVEATGPQSSHLLTSLVKANCLIIVPEDVEFLKKGDFVEVELL